MDAYGKFKVINLNTIITEDDYDSLQTEFQNEWLYDIAYVENLARHRQPIAYMNESLRLLEIPLREIQQRPELAHSDAKERNYVHHKVTDIWDRDITLKSEYEAILIYCKKHGKDANTILVHLAEYRGLQKLYEKIRLEAYQNINKPMAKKFETEIRQSPREKYLKIFLREAIDHAAIAIHIEKLASVRICNVTKQQSGKFDLTAYPAKTYDIEETKEEIEFTLDNYFKGNPVDPKFVKETVSSVSNDAYHQVLDYMINLGVSLEGFKRLGERFDEEGYRDYFIPYLNTISQHHSATAEAFHKGGKTDILFMNNKGEPVLIAECKLWKGEKYLLEAIDQLISNYVSWRDEKIALIVFNRDNKKFSEVIDTAVNALQKHPLFKIFVGRRKQTSYSFVFKNKDDESREIFLELLLFNFA